jgi:apolipoprotein N-acyltransferase
MSLPPALWLAPAGLLTYAGIAHQQTLTLLLGVTCMLRFTRGVKTLGGALLSVPVMAVVLTAGFRGAGVELFGSYATYAGAMLCAAAVGFLPLLADRSLAPRIGGFGCTLVFPLARTSVEYLLALGGPYGQWGSLAAFSSQLLPLSQLVSVTGIWGVSFLLAWLCSTAEWACSRRSRQEGRRAVARGVALCASVFLAVCAWGLVRLVFFPPAAPAVKVAAITLAEDSDDNDTGDLWSLYESGNISPRDLGRLRAAFRKSQDYLFEQAGKAAQAGAKIIVWAEDNGAVLKEDEASFIARGQKFARARGVYLGMTLLTLNRRASNPEENKIVMITPSGEVAWQYYKAHPFGDEETGMVRGDGKLLTLDTPYGRIGGVICYDTEFIGYAREAGRAGVDLLLAPSNDWREIYLARGLVTQYRALENGATLVRPTSYGLTEVVDYQGRVLGQMDYFQDANHLLLVDVPFAGRPTLYARYGDAFAWLCIAGFLYAGIKAAVRSVA